MKRTMVLSSIVVVAVVALAGRALVAQQQPAGPKVAAIEKVKDNLYMVTGGGGNTAVFVTGNGVVLVDTKLADWGQAIMDQVEDRHRQAGDPHHQHPHPRRSHRQQRLLPGLGRDRGARQRDHEHAEDAAVRRRVEEARAARQDLHGQADRARRQRRHRPLSLRSRPHQRRHVRGVPRPQGDARRRRLRDEGHAVHRSRATAGPASRIPRRSPRSRPASRTSTR